MKPAIKISILAIILCVAVVLVVLVAGLPKSDSSTDETTNPPTITTTAPPETTLPEITLPPLDGQALYDAAKDAVQQAKHQVLSYTATQDRIVNNDRYTQTITGTGWFADLSMENFAAVIEETRTYGSYSNTYKETYCQETAYAEMAGLVFSKAISQADFLQRHLPAMLIDSSLYGSIVPQRTDSGILLQFSDATALESWMAPEGATLLQASGEVLLSSDGALLESSYAAEYSLGDVTYTYTAQVQFSVQEALDLSEMHIHYTGSQSVEDLDVLSSLMQVAGDLFTANALRCEAVEIIDCQQIPLVYRQESSYQLLEDGTSFQAGADYVSQISDYREQVSTRIQSDSFVNGVFSSVIDGNEPITDPEMTQEKMRQLIEDAILSAMMAPNYLSGATRAENETSYVIHMTGNDAFCKDLMAVITNFLQVDLDALATSYKTTVAQGYLTIDKQTMLPTAMGITFQRIHTTDGVDYTLKYSMEHTLQLSGE